MDPAMQLGKSLDSRRSSGTSKKSAPIIGGRGSAEALSPAENSDSNTATRGASLAGGKYSRYNVTTLLLTYSRYVKPRIPLG
jgi:hypothetical protein